MSTSAEGTFVFACPDCGKTLRVPNSQAGKMGRCPGCRSTLRLPETLVAGAVPNQPPAVPPVRTPAAASPGLPPADTFTANRADTAAELDGLPKIDVGQQSVADQVRTRAVAEGGAFAPEKKGIGMGVVGGLLMMGIAVVWFFGGLAVGYIFFYPPILFLIGVFAFFKGLFTGNLAGNRRASRRNW